mgnify:CR=1 FL=1
MIYFIFHLSIILIARQGRFPEISTLVMLQYKIISVIFEYFMLIPTLSWLIFDRLPTDASVWISSSRVYRSPTWFFIGNIILFGINFSLHCCWKIVDLPFKRLFDDRLKTTSFIFEGIQSLFPIVFVILGAEAQSLNISVLWPGVMSCVFAVFNIVMGLLCLGYRSPSSRKFHLCMMGVYLAHSVFILVFGSLEQSAYQRFLPYIDVIYFLSFPFIIKACYLINCRLLEPHPADEGVDFLRFSTNRILLEGVMKIMSRNERAPSPSTLFQKKILISSHVLSCHRPACFCSKFKSSGKDQIESSLEDISTDTLEEYFVHLLTAQITNTGDKIWTLMNFVLFQANQLDKPIRACLTLQRLQPDQLSKYDKFVLTSLMLYLKNLYKKKTESLADELPKISLFDSIRFDKSRVELNDKLKALRHTMAEFYQYLITANPVDLNKLFDQGRLFYTQATQLEKELETLHKANESEIELLTLLIDFRLNIFHNAGKSMNLLLSKLNSLKLKQRNDALEQYFHKKKFDYLSPKNVFFAVDIVDKVGQVTHFTSNLLKELNYPKSQDILTIRDLIPHEIAAEVITMLEDQLKKTSAVETTGRRLDVMFLSNSERFLIPYEGFMKIEFNQSSGLIGTVALRKLTTSSHFILTKPSGEIIATTEGVTSWLHKHYKHSILGKNICLMVPALLPYYFETSMKDELDENPLINAVLSADDRVLNPATLNLDREEIVATLRHLDDLHANQPASKISLDSIEEKIGRFRMSFDLERSFQIRIKFRKLELNNKKYRVLEIIRYTNYSSRVDLPGVETLQNLMAQKSVRSRPEFGLLRAKSSIYNTASPVQAHDISDCEIAEEEKQTAQDPTEGFNRPTIESADLNHFTTQGDWKYSGRNIFASNKNFGSRGVFFTSSIERKIDTPMQSSREEILPTAGNYNFKTDRTEAALLNTDSKSKIDLSTPIYERPNFGFAELLENKLFQKTLESNPPHELGSEPLAASQNFVSSLKCEESKQKEGENSVIFPKVVGHRQRGDGRDENTSSQTSGTTWSEGGRLNAMIQNDVKYRVIQFNFFVGLVGVLIIVTLFTTQYIGYRGRLNDLTILCTSLGYPVELATHQQMVAKDYYKWELLREKAAFPVPWIDTMLRTISLPAFVNVVFSYSSLILNPTNVSSEVNAFLSDPSNQIEMSFHDGPNLNMSLMLAALTYYEASRIYLDNAVCKYNWSRSDVAKSGYLIANNVDSLYKKTLQLNDYLLVKIQERIDRMLSFNIILITIVTLVIGILTICCIMMYLQINNKRMKWLWLFCSIPKADLTLELDRINSFLHKTESIKQSKEKPPSKDNKKSSRQNREFVYDKKRKWSQIAGFVIIFGLFIIPFAVIFADTKHQVETVAEGVGQINVWVRFQAQLAPFMALQFRYYHNINSTETIKNEIDAAKQQIYSELMSQKAALERFIFYFGELSNQDAYDEQSTKQILGGLSNICTYNEHPDAFYNEVCRDVAGGIANQGLTVTTNYVLTASERIYSQIRGSTDQAATLNEIWPRPDIFDNDHVQVVSNRYLRITGDKMVYSFILYMKDMGQQAFVKFNCVVLLILFVLGTGWIVWIRGMQRWLNETKSILRILPKHIIQNTAAIKNYIKQEIQGSRV